MPSPITALELIKAGMRAIGAIAVGETPTSAEIDDGLRALNDVIETWNIQGLAVYGGLPQSFTTVPGTNTYTIGTGGAWDTDRPVEIFAAYCTVSGVDFPIGRWTLAEWMDQPIKTQQQPIIERLVYVNDAPLGSVILWPTPSDAVPVVLDIQQQIGQAVTQLTSFSLPPGYARALQYAIAVELAPQYGAQPPVEYAKSTMALVKKSNRQLPIARFDGALLGNRSPSWQRGY